ncbi:lanthionine synthetase-like protein [Chitinophaga niastensis]|uniref:Lanthionine synthetase-like protein n=1 Tax=Chitinophaga niastensis TaxID=536980 RepID=A0A2P8HPA7_CHINA|nr:lanthionine synthetase LanC family protein [Chitinophaga niastensis]PSL48027.1 lanthionine synthetase-like protein [Chitinophaga niastensis]
MNNTTSQLQHIYNDMILLLSHDKYDPGYSNSLFKGPWGGLLFMFYYEQYVDEQADNAAALLEKLYTAYAPEEGSNYSFCSGHTGPFWLLDHLNRHEFLDINVDDLAADFITSAIVQSNFHIANKNFDFLHGSAGICNFLLSFTKRTDVVAHLEHFVHTITELSEMTDKGRSLPFFFTHDKPQGIYVNSFSLAHGSCAVLIILAKIYEAGIAREACKQLIAESITFILHHKNKVTAASLHALYPAILDGKSSSSRLSWCYGDLNVAIALWHCGKTLAEKSWMDDAINIMYYNIRRDTDETAGIMDNCICHGSGGIAAFYRKFWFETNDMAFYKCATHWHKRAVEKISFSEDGSQHGIKVWQGKDKQWDYSWDLLDGGSGVGLSLLSHLHQQPLSWDECFLLS